MENQESSSNTPQTARKRFLRETFKKCVNLLLEVPQKQTTIFELTLHFQPQTLKPLL